MNPADRISDTETRAIALRAAGLALYAKGGRSDVLALQLLDKADAKFRRARRLRAERKATQP